MSTIPDADRYERRYHHEIQKHAKAVMTHRAAWRRWVLKAADADVPVLEIAEMSGTTVEEIMDVVERDRILNDGYDH